LAQAALLVCYEIHMAVPPTRDSKRIVYPPAAAERIEEFLQTLSTCARLISSKARVPPPKCAHCEA
jgi:tRNA C32,U32 (ribose-2'-O)-methylase TrmJ